MPWRDPQPKARNYSMQKAKNSWQMVEGRQSHQSLLPIDYWFEDCEALLIDVKVLYMPPTIAREDKGEKEWNG